MEYSRVAESPPHSLGKPTTFSGLSALTSMMAAGTESLPPSSLVTPDYQPHGIRSLKGPGKEELSLSITKEAIMLTADGGKSPRSPKKIQLAPRTAPSQKLGVVPPPSPSSSKRSKSTASTGSGRLNKFVRRLYDMLAVEQGSGVVEWRRGLLVIYSTDSFTKKLLPKYFNTRNFKTFRRQLNYYGFIHTRSFSTTGSSTTALWVNRDLAKRGTDDISSVLELKRVEPCEAAKTAEGRRERKELAINTVEEDIGVSAKTLQLEQIRSMTLRGEEDGLLHGEMPAHEVPIPLEVSFSLASEGFPRPTKRVSLLPANTCLHPDHEDEEEDGLDRPMSYEEQCVSAGAAHVLMMLSRARGA